MWNESSEENRSDAFGGTDFFVDGGWLFGDGSKNWRQKFCADDRSIF